MAKNFRSSLLIRYGEKIADLRSILSVVALCATMGAALDIEAAGDDEREAVRAIEQVFRTTADLPGTVADAGRPEQGRRTLSARGG